MGCLVKLPAQRKHRTFRALIELQRSCQRGGGDDQRFIIRYELCHAKACGAVINKNIIPRIKELDRFSCNCLFFRNMFLCTGGKRNAVNILFSWYGSPSVGADSLSLGNKHVDIPPYGHFRDMKKGCSGARPQQNLQRIKVFQSGKACTL